MANPVEQKVSYCKLGTFNMVQPAGINQKASQYFTLVITVRVSLVPYSIANREPHSPFLNVQLIQELSDVSYCKLYLSENSNFEQDSLEASIFFTLVNTVSLSFPATISGFRTRFWNHECHLWVGATGPTHMSTWKPCSYAFSHGPHSAAPKKNS